MSARKTPAQHTVRVVGYRMPTVDDGGSFASAPEWTWIRFSANNVRVAYAAREWEDKSKAVRAARSEARLTGARLVIDGEEVQP